MSVHQVVVAISAGAGVRARQAAGPVPKVSGSGKKTRGNKKGGGRARAGSSRHSPLWRSGGIIFSGASGRNHSQKVKEPQDVPGALRCMASELTTARPPDCHRHLLRGYPPDPSPPTRNSKPSNSATYSIASPKHRHQPVPVGANLKNVDVCDVSSAGSGCAC